MFPIENLHYNYRLRRNVVDSEQRFNFTVEQIDEYLNQALNLYINLISREVEYDQTRIDELRPLLKVGSILSITSSDSEKTVFNLPNDYYRRIRSVSIPDECSSATIRHTICQFDDLDNYLQNDDYKPSLSWRKTPVTINGNFLTVYHLSDFTPTITSMDYIVKHPRLGNPEKSRAGAYNLPDGTPAIQQGLLLDTVNQPDKIVEIAVLNTTMDTGGQEYQLRLQQLLNLNRI
ncbi:MAG TPA: hypothetical protein PKD00_06100 [Burkholderiales bacterium]|nr:hypothetical protein [Burkholderiales bacterium]